MDPLQNTYDFLKPLPPIPPPDVNPIYFFFIPQKDIGVPPEICEKMTRIQITNHWRSLPFFTDPDNRYEVGRLIDLMQLAQTCRHAAHYIDYQQIKEILRQIFMNLDRDVLHWFAPRIEYTYGSGSNCLYRMLASLLAGTLRRPKIMRLVAPSWGWKINFDVFEMLVDRPQDCSSVTFDKFIKVGLVHDEGFDLSWHWSKRAYCWWLVLTMIYQVPDMNKKYLEQGFAGRQILKQAKLFATEFHESTRKAIQFILDFPDQGGENLRETKKLYTSRKRVLIADLKTESGGRRAKRRRIV